MLSVNPLLLVTEEQYREIYKELDVNEIEMQRAIENISAWYQMQPHLPKIKPDKKTIRVLLIANKMSLEKVKSKMDNKCVLRNLVPEIFKYSDIYRHGLKEITKNLYWIPLPKLSKDLTRITVLKCVGSPEEFSLAYHAKRSFLVGEYRLYNDLCISDRYIMDLEQLKLSHLTKLNPMLIKKCEISNSKAFGMRISGIHIINAPTYVDKLVSILKQALKPKLAERIVLHENVEDLYKYISREILPKEYGGDERSLDVLRDEWYDELTNEKWKKMFIEEEKLISNESRRLQPQKDEDILGIQGSFRKLDVD